MSFITRSASFLFLAAILLQGCGKDDGEPLPTAVYAVGRTGSSATYWKNGVAVSLPGTTLTSEGTGIATLGKDVYVCGYQYNPGTNAMATLWEKRRPDGAQ